MRSVFKPLSEIFCGALSFDAEVGLREAKNNLPGKSIMGNVSTFAMTQHKVNHTEQILRQLENIFNLRKYQERFEAIR